LGGIGTVWLNGRGAGLVPSAGSGRGV
jgi:hypothetical protein